MNTLVTTPEPTDEWEYTGLFSVTFKSHSDGEDERKVTSMIMAFFTHAGFRFDGKVGASPRPLRIKGSKESPWRQGLTVYYGEEFSFTGYASIEKIETNDGRVLWQSDNSSPQ